MKILRSTIYSRIVGFETEELSHLMTLLTFQVSRGKDRCLVTDDGEFHTGLIPLLQAKGVDFEIEDVEQPYYYPIKDAKNINKSILANRILRDYQISAVRKALIAGRGVVQSPTGSGKTEMAAAIVAHMFDRGLITSACFVTPTIFLMDQMANRFEEMGLGKVTRVGGGHKFNSDNPIVIYVADSAHNHLVNEPKEESATFIKNADFLGLDEAHHSSSNSWMDVAEACPAKIRLAFTATVYSDPTQWSYKDLFLLGLTGPIIFDIRSKELRQRGFLADPFVTLFKCHQPVYNWEWVDVYRHGIVRNDTRNSMIVSLTKSIYEGGYKTMTFIGQKSQGHQLAKSCAEMGCESIFVHGGSRTWVYYPSGRRDIHNWDVQDIANYINSRDRCNLVTTQVLDEGVDIPVINCLIMGTGMKKYRRTIQRVGRGMRPKPGQNKVFIFDFWDTSHEYLLEQSRYRKWTYEQEEFDFSLSLDETSKAMGCPIILRKDLYQKELLLI